MKPRPATASLRRQGTASLRERATLRRSIRLLADFRFEQTDPARFYGHVARDTVLILESIYRDLTGSELAGTRILDVGGGPGYFSAEFATTGARYIAVEPDPREMHVGGLPTVGSVRGSGMALPFRDDSVDICFSSNVVEHVIDPWLMAEEMLRVTKPGGLVLISYTVWLGPFGGHETGRIRHWFGGRRAADRYARKNGKRPKNDFGTSLFAVTAADGLRWARTYPDEFVAAFPRYHPRWAWWVVRLPGLREVLTSNLVLVLQPRVP